MIAQMNVKEKLGVKKKKWYQQHQKVWQLYAFCALPILLFSLYSLAVSFPFPIILALAFNELTHARSKKILQTIIYAPYFTSTVVMVSILMQVFHYRYGVINEIFVCANEYLTYTLEWR